MPKIVFRHLGEHGKCEFERAKFPENSIFHNKLFDAGRNLYCYTVNENTDGFVKIQAYYCIGVDWLLENHTALIVFPKLNSRLSDIEKAKESEDEIEVEQRGNKGEEVVIDYFAMLNECLDSDFLYKEIDNLVKIDWKVPEISVTQEMDWLSPLLIVKFLNVLKSIVKKGLKKSYYKTVENLNGKVKGKILVELNIKKNLVKSTLTKTICQYEEFGFNNIENRLLKKTLEFASRYIDNNKKLFGTGPNHFAETVNYCRPAFEAVSIEVEPYHIKNFKANPFFKEYNEGIYLAKLILKRFSYSLSNTSNNIISTPPYWIDMPRLFELYAYSFLKKVFSEHNQVKYQFSTYGNKLDFLINAGKNKLVVDAKYKSVYLYGKNHDDIRQVAGYARLEKVYNELGISDNSLIDCLIIYPDIECGYSVSDLPDTNVLEKKKPITGYKNIYSLGIKLPIR